MKTIKSASHFLTLGSIFLISGFNHTLAKATTLEELIEKEEALDLGACPLSPKPKIAGESGHLNRLDFCRPLGSFE